MSTAQTTRPRAIAYLATSADGFIADPNDDLVVTIIPTVLGASVSLFDAATPRTDLTVVYVAKFADGFVQMHYRCR